MKTKLILLFPIFLVSTAAFPATTPVYNGVLQTDLNANGKAITNTAAGNSNSVSVGSSGSNGVWFPAGNQLAVSAGGTNAFWFGTNFFNIYAMSGTGQASLIAQYTNGGWTFTGSVTNANAVSNASTIGVSGLATLKGGFASLGNSSMSGGASEPMFTIDSTFPTTTIGYKVSGSTRGSFGAIGTPSGLCWKLSDTTIGATFVDATGGAAFRGTLTATNGFVSKVTTAPTVISVGASPFTYTAGGINETVVIGGGTVSAIVWAGTSIPAALLTLGESYPLGPGQTLVVTYTVAPSMVSKPF